MDLHDIRVDMQDSLGSMLLSTVDFMFTNPGTAALVAAVPAAVIVTLYVAKKMNRQGLDDDMRRKVQLESHYADRIHDFMLDDLTNGVISRKEYMRDLKRMGIAYRLFDLLRPMKAKNGIKHRVRRNCAVNHDTLQFIKPGVIPGPKPGEDLPSAPVVKKRKIYLVAVGSKRAAGTK